MIHSLLFLVASAGQHTFTLLAGGCPETCDATKAPDEFSECIHKLPCPYLARDVYTAATEGEFCGTAAKADEIFTFKPGLGPTWAADEFATVLAGPDDSSAAACLGSMNFVSYVLAEGATEDDFKAAVCQNKRPTAAVAIPTKWESEGLADSLAFLLLPHSSTYITIEGDSMCSGFTYPGFEMHFLDTNILDGSEGVGGGIKEAVVATGVAALMYL